MSRMTVFAPRASVMYELPNAHPPAEHPSALLPAEEPAQRSHSKVRRMFRSSMDHMKKVRRDSVLTEGLLSRSPFYPPSNDAQIWCLLCIDLLY